MTKTKSVKIDSAVDLLKSLIACPSLTPDDGGCLDKISELLQAAGYNTQRLPSNEVDNLWVTLGATPPRLIFIGHVDVVGAGDLSKWHSNPFIAHEESGYIYGRGAADMKSGVAAMVHALMTTPRDGVGLFLTSDEEGPALHGSRYFVDWWRKQAYDSIDYGIVAEPTSEQVFGDSIKIGRRGSLTARLHINGEQAHVAYAHRGDNPAHRLSDILQALTERWRSSSQRQASGELLTTFQIVDIKSGMGSDNVSPPYASASFNFRYITADTQNTLRDICEQVFETFARGKWRCEWINNAQPYCIPNDGKLVSTLSQVVKNHTGQVANLTSSGGASDGRFFKDICKELVEFGVCNASIHQTNECVRSEDVNQLSCIFQQTMKELL